MRLLNISLAILIFGLALVHAFPHASDDDPLVYRSSSLDKRAVWNVKDLSSAHKTAVDAGLADAMSVVKVVLGRGGMLNPKHSAKVAQWFGPSYANLETYLRIYSVFLNMYNPNEAGNDVTYGTKRIGNINVWNTDYWLPDRGIVPLSVNANAGKTSYCKLKDQNGKVGSLYFAQRNGQPGIHFCDRAWHAATLKQWMLAPTRGCKNMGSVLDAATMMKTFLGSVILHELFHYELVGKVTLSHNIIDIAYGAKPCLDLKHTSGQQIISRNPDFFVDKSNSTLYNADTWTWFALHIFWEEICSRTFSEPTADDPPSVYPVFPIQDTDENPVYTSDA